MAGATVSRGQVHFAPGLFERKPDDASENSFCLMSVRNLIKLVSHKERIQKSRNRVLLLTSPEEAWGGLRIHFTFYQWLKVKQQI